jgi:hypothetical protein
VVLIDTEVMLGGGGGGDEEPPPQAANNISNANATFTRSLVKIMVLKMT